MRGSGGDGECLRDSRATLLRESGTKAEVNLAPCDWHRAHIGYSIARDKISRCHRNRESVGYDILS